MVGLLKLKTLQRKEFADFCQPEIYYSCSTIWYLMRIWQADCYFFFTWQIEKCDFLICILITPPLISLPCTFLVIRFWRVNTLWLSLLALPLKMDKENLISLCFSDLPMFGGGLEKMLFVTSKESGKSFRWKVRLLDSATTLGPSQLPGILLFPCHCSSHGRGVISCCISCCRHCYYLISS